jgi:hypothetical protein
MRVRFVGSGDAFGSGGRWQTCIHVSGEGQSRAEIARTCRGQGRGLRRRRETSAMSTWSVGSPEVCHAVGRFVTESSLSLRAPAQVADMRAGVRPAEITAAPCWKGQSVALRAGVLRATRAPSPGCRSWRQGARARRTGYPVDSCDCCRSGGNRSEELPVASREVEGKVSD